MTNNLTVKSLAVKKSTKKFNFLQINTNLRVTLSSIICNWRRELINMKVGANPARGRGRSHTMFVTGDINPYALMAIEREYAEIIMPQYKKSFTEAYRKTVNTVKEQIIESGTEPFDEYSQLSITPTELIEFPQNDTLSSKFLEMGERVSIDYYA